MLLADPTTGATLQADEGTRTHQLLTRRGWKPTNQPSPTGARLVTAADLQAVTARLDQLTPGLAPKVDELGQRVDTLLDLAGQAIEGFQTVDTELRAEVVAVDEKVEQVAATVAAPTAATAPKPTPRTDALEAAVERLDGHIADILATVKALDLPAAVAAHLASVRQKAPAATTGEPLSTTLTAAAVAQWVTSSNAANRRINELQVEANGLRSALIAAGILTA